MRSSIVVIAILFLTGACMTQSVVDIMCAKLAKYKSLTSAQASNARAIMTQCVQYTSNVNQLAYVLSTAIGESNITPIKEYRAKEGTSLWTTQNRYWYSGYYGRGYVQLTWDYNYKKFGQLLGVDLLGKPDLALDPSIAGKIICIGMTRGLFTGKGLNDYFSGSNADWTNARRIVNGTDKAADFGNRGRDIAAK